MISKLEKTSCVYRLRVSKGIPCCLLESCKCEESFNLNESELIRKQTPSEQLQDQLEPIL